MYFSLVIPHFNIPQLLRRCLKSVPCREDLQVIVVDDASSVENVEKLHMLESEFPYVEFAYMEENLGGGVARNLGLEKAKGKYIFFADADDFFMPNLGQFLDDVKEKDFDLIFFNAISVDTDSYAITYRCWHLNRFIRMKSSNLNRSVFELKYAFGEPWCKMIKRSVIEKNVIRFDETRIHNDTRFSYLVGHFCDSVFVDERSVYCVTDRTGSVSKVLTPERMIARAKVFADANYFFKKNGVKRFDERAVRPLVKFLFKMDLKNFKKCKNVLCCSGMSSLDIYIKILIYPFYAFQKVCSSMSQYSMRLFG